MRQFSELPCLCAIYALIFICEACVTPTDDPLKTINITFTSADMEFRYHNASNLSDSSLWAVITWEVIGGEDIDGILYKSSGGDDGQNTNTIGPPPGFPVLPLATAPKVCDGVTDIIWAVNETSGTSVQCQVPCENILVKPCAIHGVCRDLKTGYNSISRESRSLELPARFGHRLDFALKFYKDWKVGYEHEIVVDAAFCRHELIVKHKISEEVADEFCAEHQDIDENTHSSGTVANLRVATVRRNMEDNTGVVTLEWQEPHDIEAGAHVTHYSISSSFGTELDEIKVDASDKDENDYYRVIVRNIEFETTMTVQIVPTLNVSNCTGCTEHGAYQTIDYTFTDIDACSGDNTTAPYCDAISNCTDLGPKSRTAAVCSCPRGYDGNAISRIFSQGTGCYDLDSCAKEDAMNSTCDPNAICTDFAPPEIGLNCSCPDPFIGDGYRSGSGCREESLIIGLAVGIPAAIIVVLIVVGIALKTWSERRRKIEEKLSRFKTLHGIEYTTSAYTISNGQAAPAFGEKCEIDRNAIELKGIIGRGNFGVVQKALYKSEHEQRLVAVKMTTENPSEQLKHAFLSEISMIMQCGEHDNLIGIIGCCTTGDQPIYMVSEYMKYGDLLHFLWKAREDQSVELDPVYNLTEYSIYQIANQVACGLRHLVDVKIIHGDIAARNILVGEGLQCKISDFGLANDVYRYGMIKGAAEKTVPLKWISPERMMGGTVPITWRSDVWSFGILLYETITLGSSPYPNIDSDELFERLKSGYRMERPDYCSQYLYDIMDKCWQWSPSKRPSFKQLSAVLRSQVSDDNRTYANLIAVVPNIERGTDTPIRNGIHANGHANGYV